jgi:hypothetical protein
LAEEFLRFQRSGLLEEVLVVFLELFEGPDRHFAPFFHYGLEVSSVDVAFLSVSVKSPSKMFDERIKIFVDILVRIFDEVTYFSRAILK